MSTELKKYLLSGARDVPQARTTSFEGSNLALALRRHAHAYAQSRPNVRNRLSLDLESASNYAGYGGGGKSYLEKDYSNSGLKVGGVPGVKYRGAISDLSTITNRRSLDLEALAAGKPTTPSGRRTVTFHLPQGVDPNSLGVNGLDYITQYHFENDRQEDDNADENFQERSSRTRRRRREDMVRDDSVDVDKSEEHVGVSPQLAKLVEVTPNSYAEAQRLKKMLKRAVSGPNATFEDLKLYRTTMKRLRRIVKLEQEREIELANEESREAQLHHDQDQVRYFFRIPLQNKKIKAFI